MDSYVCSKCGVEKPLSEFNKRSDRPRGHDYRCRVCHNAQKKEIETKTRDTRLLKRKASYEKNKLELRKKALARYHQNRDHNLARHTEYRKRNGDKYSVYGREREAAKAKATPAWSDKARRNKLYYIARRLSVVTGIEHQVDHIVPLRSKLVCGLHTEQNMRVIAKDQNVSKRNTHWPDMP